MASNTNTETYTLETMNQLLGGIDHENSTNLSVNVSQDDVASIMRNPWDPSHCADWDAEKPSATCITRIKRDICSVFKDPPPGMFIVPDQDNITKIHALVIGPFDTPYEGGFFYFLIRCPPDYPIRAPRCRLMTTGNNTVRFNPNLYRNGKVCLSILGTWSGPGWSPAQCISSLLISIQSLMSEKPYHNEPGFEQERNIGDSQTYNEIIKHETLRVAVCDMLENENSCPPQLREVMIKQFFDFYDYYVEVCAENQNKEGQQMNDPFGDRRGQFEYKRTLNRLKRLKAHLESKDNTKGTDEVSPKSPNHTYQTLDPQTHLDQDNDEESSIDEDDIFDDAMDKAV